MPGGGRHFPMDVIAGYPACRCRPLLGWGVACQPGEPLPCA